MKRSGHPPKLCHHRRMPSGHAKSRGHDHTGRRLLLHHTIIAHMVPGGSMIIDPDEKIIYRIKHLPIRCLGFPHGHPLFVLTSGDHFRQKRLQVPCLKWKKLPLPPLYIRIDTHQRLPVQILHDVRHQTVLSHGNHNILRSEDHVGNIIPVNLLHSGIAPCNRAGTFQRFIIVGMLRLVV